MSSTGVVTNLWPVAVAVTESSDTALSAMVAQPLSANSPAFHQRGRSRGPLPDPSLRDNGRFADMWNPESRRDCALPNAASVFPSVVSQKCAHLDTAARVSETGALFWLVVEALGGCGLVGQGPAVRSTPVPMWPSAVARGPKPGPPGAQ